MHPSTHREAERIFIELLDLAPDLRPGRLQETCAGQAELQQEVQALLRASEQADAFFDALRQRLGLVDASAQSVQPVENVDRAGQSLGAYTLTHLLGRGGMGEVWCAERADGRYAGQVAIKLLAAPGAISRHSFEREAQHLARLSHPNIARLLDADATPQGQPYLVLEVVDGEPIDAHCDRQRLTIEQRVRLFLQVLDAIAHAHANLVVHRDIKPSNVRVTPQGQVKVLDFGVSKLISGDEPVAAGGAMPTLALALTPQYAAPEQIDGAAVTTATDVYALGLLLWALVAGRTPRSVREFRSMAELRAAALAEPGSLLDSATRTGAPQALAEAARQRGLTVGQFEQALGGDLDPVLRKAVAVEPGERYATASEFAQDLRRYLAQEPVAARAPTAAYRLRKFVRRNRLAVSAGGAVVTAVLAGAAIALWQMSVAQDERRLAVQALGFLAQVFRHADPAVGRAERTSAADLLKRARARVDAEFAGQPDARVQMLNTLAETFLGVQDSEGADEASATALREALALHGEQHTQTLRARAARVRLHRARYELVKWRAELETALPLLTAQPERHAALLMQAWVDLANLELAERKLEQAEATARGALAQADRLRGAWDEQRSALWQAISTSHDSRLQFAAATEAAALAVRHAEAAWPGQARHPQVVNARYVQGRLMMFGARPGDAVLQLARAVEDASALWGSQSLPVAQYMQALAYAQIRAGQLEQATQSASRVVELTLRHYPADSLFVAAALDVQAFVHLQARRPEHALPLYERLLAEYFGAPQMREQALTASMRRALMQAWLGRFDNALPELSRIAEEYARVGRGSVTAPLHSLATAERLAGRPEAALEKLQRAMAAVREGPQAARERLGVRADIGITLQALGRDAEAEPMLRAALAEWDGMGLAPTPLRSDVVQALGRAVLAQGHAQAALPFLAEADAYWQRAQADAPSAGEAAHWLARGLDAAGDVAASRAALKRSLPVLARSPLPAHHALAKASPSDWGDQRRR